MKWTSDVGLPLFFAIVYAIITLLTALGWVIYDNITSSQALTLCLLWYLVFREADHRLKIEVVAKRLFKERLDKMKD